MNDRVSGCGESAGAAPGNAKALYDPFGVGRHSVNEVFGISNSIGSGFRVRVRVRVKG